MVAWRARWATGNGRELVGVVGGSQVIQVSSGPVIDDHRDATFH